MALLRSKRRINQHSDTESDTSVESDTDTASQTDNNGKIFEMVGELPSSIDPPSYNSTLTHSLSIRDSAVLYNSLILSRNTWIHNMGNIFALYWLKEGRNAYEKNFTGFSIKDKMQKMCDARLFGGPHCFPIRLFILKDDEIEKEWQDMQEQKKVDKQKKKEDVIQLKQLKQEERAKKRELRERIKEEQKQVKLQSKLENEKLRLERKEELRRLKLELKSKQKVRAPKNSPQTYNNNDSNSNNRLNSQKSNTSAANDTNMIANLNKMAQNDINLSALMNKVAKGLASKQEVEEFKKIIDIAKRMPRITTTQSIPPLLPLQKPTSVIKKSSDNIQNTTTNNNSSFISSTNTFQDIDNHSSNSIDHTAVSNNSNRPDSQSSVNTGIPNANATINNNNNRTDIIDSNNTNISSNNNTPNENSSTQESIIDPKIKQQTADNNIDNISNTNTSTSNTTENNSIEPTNMNIPIKDEETNNALNSSPVKKRPGRKPKLKDPNEDSEDRLTTFQTKYLKNATLLIEFIEDKNIRYYLPRESIIELVESENEFIVSFIVIHNMREMNKFAKRSKTTWSTELLFKENCPKPMFSSMTITIKDIPKRFHPIMLNSMKPLDNTQKWMKKVIDDGIRLSGYHLWYQLDGYDDSKLAESLRQNLVNYENGLKPKRLRKMGP